MRRWNRLLGLLVVMGVAVSRSFAAEPEEGKLVPSTRTDFPMNTHIWIGGPVASNPLVPMPSTPTPISRCLYLARYSGGDWDYSAWFEEGYLAGGSLKNLSDTVMANSRGRIGEALWPGPLDIDTSVLSFQKPVCLFLTGTKDFVFTNEEVMALRRYLIQGGCLWVDNGSPGPDSAFDKAFRREIKRVLWNDGATLEPLPMTHPLFKKSWYEITKLPAGSTGLQAPLEQIEMDGTLAVLYMPNGYALLWTKPKEETGPNVEAWRRATELGMNCVVYLLTR